MIAGIAILVCLFMMKGLIGKILNAANNDAPVMVANTMKGGAEASRALPTMGSQFSNDIITDSLETVEGLKEKLGCTDENIKTHLQLSKWMTENGYC